MDLVNALFALSRLDALPRTGWSLAGVPQPESLAGHTLGVAFLVLAMAPDEPQGLDVGSALAMALVHDAPEALSGDLPKAASQALPPGAKASMEDQLAGILLGPLGFQASQAWRDYRAQATPEARFVKACDQLHMGQEAVRLLRAGQRGLWEFGRGLESRDWSEFPGLATLWNDLRREWVEYEDFRTSSPNETSA